MSLLDQHPGVVDAFRKTELVHASLQPTFQEVFDFQGQHVIEFHARFIEHTDTDETADEGIAFEESFRVFFFQREKLTGRPRQ